MSGRGRTTWIAVCILAGTACATPRPDPQELVAGAAALDAEFIAAVNRGDAEAVANTYWRDPQVSSIGVAGFGAEGWEAVREAVAQAVAGMGGASMEFVSQHNVPVGDVVVGWGAIRLTMPTPDGASTEMMLRYTDVKGVRDGRWVYLADHGSAPLSPPSG